MAGVKFVCLWHPIRGKCPTTTIIVSDRPLSFYISPSEWASIKPSICVFEIRGWANVSSRGRVADETTDHWHWRWPGAGSTNKVDQDKSVGQNSELFLVPNCLLSLARPQQPAEMNWKCHLMFCIPETSVCVKPSQYNPVCGATRRNAMHQPSAGWKEYLCTEQRPRPWPGLASLTGTRVRTREGFTGCWGGVECLHVSVSPCPLYPHNKTIASIRGRGDLDILISTHTQSSIINNGTQLIDNT